MNTTIPTVKLCLFLHQIIANLPFRYSERKYYNYENPIYGSSGVIGHFTQLVWKSSQKVGVGIASKITGGNTKTVIVARYSPPGNIHTTEEYKANVMQPNNPNGNVYNKLSMGWCWFLLCQVTIVFFYFN